LPAHILTQKIIIIWNIYIFHSNATCFSRFLFLMFCSGWKKKNELFAFNLHSIMVEHTQSSLTTAPLSEWEREIWKFMLSKQFFVLLLLPPSTSSSFYFISLEAYFFHSFIANIHIFITKWNFYFLFLSVLSDVWINEWLEKLSEQKLT
jgi:hypothetical protein